MQCVSRVVCRQLPERGCAAARVVLSLVGAEGVPLPFGMLAEESRVCGDDLSQILGRLRAAGVVRRVRVKGMKSERRWLLVAVAAARAGGAAVAAPALA